ncbi:hypothetical protein N7490_007605 [Penicillium lividum]|nr:hypothetical protein N7490_007605 [Penicillium lividum]
MAPVPVEDVPGIPGEAGNIENILKVSHEARDIDSKFPLTARTFNEDNIAESPSISHNYLIARSDSTTTSTSNAKYGQGTIDPHSIKMQGLLALFALIGAAFVLGAIWFFFWAKDGGFHWRKGDWDDYKSTVLRRKGPDGRTLSNATKSTKLGGGSVVGKGYSDDGYTYTDETYTQTASTIMTEDKPRRKRNFKEKILRRHRDDRWEGEGDDDVRAYREEKPAQIGGMNREADGTYHGSDYDSSAPPTHYNRSDMSEVRDYAYEKPRRSKTKQKRNASGFSFTAGSEDVLSQTTEEHQLRDPSTRRDRDREREAREARREARRQDRRSAAASSVPSSRTSSPRKKETRNVPGHFTEPLDFSSSGTRSEYQYSNVDTEDSGTKSYHHPIAGLKKGYRRDDARAARPSRRRDSLSDSDGDETRYS